MLTINRVENWAVTVFHLAGELDDMGAREFRRVITECLHDHRYQIVLNLSSLVFMSYVGVGSLLDYLGRLRALRGDIKLACVNLQARRLLGMAGLGQVLEIYEVESAAIEGYKQAAA